MSEAVMTRPSRIALSQVPGGFDRAARRYDLLTALNPGYARHLATAARVLTDALVRDARGSARLAGWAASANGPDAPGVLFDLGCGSGRSTAALLEALRGVGLAARVTGLDNSAGMLGRARRKPWPAGVGFDEASLDDPATVLGPPGGADGVFAAYLFRNLTGPDAALARVRELLRPGGRVVIVDYSVADSPVARAMWTAVCWGAVIPLSVLVGGNPALYRYLWRSVRAFDGAAAFTARCRRAGFDGVRHATFPGWQRGVLHLWSMRRAPERAQ
jgi:ubiquinone/menaquinone biosynthesis C-methylase UbiE